MKISVIIPLYNAEKYIADCLDSLLAQTFQDFEVIIVDDCSTDNSVAIVKNYAEKFYGRLRFASTKKNSGGGGYIPRNIGLEISRGEYIYFLDADDFIAETALEILYTAAKRVNADVVYTSAYYNCDSDEKFFLVNDNSTAQDKPSLIIDNPNKNLQKLLFENDFRNPWTKFSRRDFLIRNEIKFPKIISGGDFIWTIHVYCCSKRFLRLPIPLYFYRNYSAESVSRKKRTPTEQSFHWMSAFVAWLKALNELAKKIEILRQNPALCCQASNLHFYYCMGRCFEARMQLNTQELYEYLYREFADDSTLPFFLSIIDAQQKELSATRRRIDELTATFKNKFA